MTLPTFKYHPDPVATGAIMQSQGECPCCERNRGFEYANEPYQNDRTVEQELCGICPWCIADGSAAAKFGARFVDIDASDEYFGGRETVNDPAIRQELCERTPPYTSWNSPRWRSHCGDYCAYLGDLEPAEMGALRDDLKDEVLAVTGVDIATLEGAYTDLYAREAFVLCLFKCLKCPQYRLHLDTTSWQWRQKLQV